MCQTTIPDFQKDYTDLTRSSENGKRYSPVVGEIAFFNDVYQIQFV